MTSSTPSSVPPGDADGLSFLAATVNKPGALYRLAELDVQQALDSVMVLPAHQASGCYVLESDVLLLLREEIQAWFKNLRELGVAGTQLSSPTARDQNARLIAQTLLDAAYATPQKAWLALLPTGRHLVIAPSAVVNALGFDLVCQVTHQRALLAAQSHGQPYNVQALQHYQSVRPMEPA